VRAGPGRSIIERGGVGELSGDDEDVLRGLKVLLDVEGCGEPDYPRAGMSQCYIFGSLWMWTGLDSRKTDVPDDYYSFVIHFARYTLYSIQRKVR
jgi:hypothetical protein